MCVESNILKLDYVQQLLMHSYVHKNPDLCNSGSDTSKSLISSLKKLYLGVVVPSLGTQSSLN